MREKNRKTILLATCLALVGGIAFSILLLPKHTWRVTSQDGAGGGGFGAGKRGLGYSSKIWKSFDGAIVNEWEVTYSSSEDARKDWEDELKTGGTIIEHTKADNSSSSNERIVKAFGNPESRGGAAQIIKLKNERISYVEAPSLKLVLDFENAWWYSEW
jgi:hypothetical protein